MRPEQLFQDLKELSEKLGITVLEHNFRNAGISVKSGICTVKGKKLIILDKNRSLNDKNEVMLSCLSGMPHESIYIVPYLRELLSKHSDG